MDQVTQISLLTRVLDLSEARTAHMVERSSHADPRRYYDPADLSREEALFRRLPLAIGHASQLGGPGAFFTHGEGGVPMVVVRDGEGGTGAFLNVCRHRGTCVEREAAGTGKRAFVCPYHGWSYDLRGRLLHIPHQEGFCDVDRAELNLVPLSHQVQAGLVWVTPTPGAPCPAAQHLGPALLAELSGFDLASHVVYRRTAFRKAFNWKIGVEIFFEAYHLKRTHEGSIYPLFFDNLALFDWFAPHMRNFFPKRSIAQLRGTDPSRWLLREHGNLLYFLFPNTLLLVQPDHVSVFHIYPRGTDETEVVFYTLLPQAPASDKERRYWDQNIDILERAFHEDMAMGESIQRGLRSGANSLLRFGRYEQSLDFFRIEVERAIAG